MTWIVSLTCFNYIPAVIVLINTFKNSNLHRELLILVKNTELQNLEFLGGIPDYSSKDFHCSNLREFQRHANKMQLLCVPLSHLRYCFLYSSLIFSYVLLIHIVHPSFHYSLSYFFSYETSWTVHCFDSMCAQFT